MTNSKFIENEQIQFLTFPKQDVLDHRKDQINRFFELQRALYLGSHEQQPVEIVFADDQGIKTVVTTVWGVSDDEVILNHAFILPLQRIMSIS